MNEDGETFNFGTLNGVRGFFTNPSRADDSFIPFSNIGYKYLSFYKSEIKTITLDFIPKTVIAATFTYTTTSRYDVLTKQIYTAGAGGGGGAITSVDIDNREVTITASQATACYLFYV